VDVSTPSAPVEVGFLDTPGQARGVFVSGAYAYVADYNNGLRIVDVSTPSAPVEVGFLDTPHFAYGVFVSGAYAYVADEFAGLRIVDVSTPSAPVEVGALDTPGSAWGVFVSGDYAFVADGITGLRIVDVSTPSAPAEVGALATPGLAEGVFVSGDFIYLAANSGGLLVIDPGVQVPAASIALTTTLDTDAAAGVSLSIPQVYDANTQSPLPGVLIGSYETAFQYNGALLQVLDVRHKAPFGNNGTTINNPGGATLFSGIAPGGAPWPAQTAFVPLRLTGCTTDSVTLTPTVNSINDNVGNPLQIGQPAPKTYRRGDAKADGAVNISDALVIAQYLAGLRGLGEDLTTVNAVNAASVKQDGAFDKITIADVLYIAQRLVGLRDGCFNLMPQGSPPER
jgi:hypothetical protein